MQKNLFLLLLPLLCCCTTETTPTPTAALARAELQKSDEKDNSYPANAANPYDIAGRLHYDVLEAYLPLETRPCTVANLIERIETDAHSNSAFLTLKTEGYDTPIATKLQYLMNHPLLSHTQVLDDSGLTLAARENISGFIAQVIQWRDQQQDFELAYPDILQYEAAVVADKRFTIHDKKVLLTNAAIIRYGLYFSARQRRKPRDRDWDHWITAITAGIEGSTQSTANAVLHSAAASALLNN